MKRSSWDFAFASLFICFLSLLISESVYAQRPMQPPPNDCGNHIAGQITAVGEKTITVRGRDGAEKIITVNNQTKFIRNKESASLSDFRVNDFVVIESDSSKDNQLVAERITGGDKTPQGPPQSEMRGGFPGGGRMGGSFPGGGTFGNRPSNFDRQGKCLQRRGGKFVSTDASAKTITVTTPDGDEQTIHITDKTIFNRNGKDATLNDFKAGDTVLAVGTKNDSGQLVAERVFGGDMPPPPPRQPKENNSPPKQQ